MKTLSMPKLWIQYHTIRHMGMMRSLIRGIEGLPIRMGAIKLPPNPCNNVQRKECSQYKLNLPLFRSWILSVALIALDAVAKIKLNKRVYYPYAYVNDARHWIAFSATTCQ